MVVLGELECMSSRAKPALEPDEPVQFKTAKWNACLRKAFPRDPPQPKAPADVHAHPGAVAGEHAIDAAMQDMQPADRCPKLPACFGAS